MTGVADLLAENAWLVVLVALLARGVLAWQRGLSWYEYRTLHGLRRLVFPILDRRVPVVSFVNHKGGRTDAEYLATIRGRYQGVVTTLRNGGGSLHLLSSLKRRPAAGKGDDPLSRAHVVWTHGDGTQTEAYLFANRDGTTDVYAHHEASVTRPLDHLGGDEQVDGDPRGVVRAALEG